MKTALLSLLSVLTLARGQLVLYNTSAAIDTAGNLSELCATALMTTINCPSNLFNSASVGELNFSDNTTVPLICAASCTESLQAYHHNVSSACGSNSYPWDGIPATWPGDFLWAFANQTCLTSNSTGQYCVDEVLNWSEKLDLNNTQLSDFPKEDLCTPCTIMLLSQSQSTSFSNYDSAMASDWQAVQKVCNVTYPWNVQPVPTNLTMADIPGFANISTSIAAPCVSGKTYTPQTNDSCDSIASTFGVATGTLIITNNLYADCSNLVTGQSLCLPQSCSLYRVQTNDTCWSIAASENVGTYQLQSWNPALNAGCTNVIPGSAVCISPPGETWNETIIIGATPTQTGAYATTTVQAPGQTPYGTTAQCGAFHEAQSGDTCQDTYGITLHDLQMWNPSLNSTCGNLITGDAYCVASPVSKGQAKEFFGHPFPVPIAADRNFSRPLGRFRHLIGI